MKFTDIPVEDLTDKNAVVENEQRKKESRKEPIKQ